MAALTAADYVVLSLVLVVSAAIGLYHACRGVTKSEEFFVANRQMNLVPVSFSLLASWMSAIAILGTPAEAYKYGTMYSYLIVADVIALLITIHFFIPLFYPLKLASVYEYLQLRFSLSVRLMGTGIFILYMVIYLSVVLFTPSLALSAVTGITWWSTVLVTGAVCTFYTALGGIKAVIWTDVFQTIVMFGLLLTVFIHGIVRVGGFENFWKITTEGGRIIFDDIRPDPTVRHTVWSVLIGGTFVVLPLFSINQVSIQRYLSCSSLKAAKTTALLGVPLFVSFMTLVIVSGLSIFAVYADCDPLSAGYITRIDQLLPYYVVNELGFVQGLTGVFVGAIFSATLSTVSSGLNSLAAVTVKDIVKVIKKDMPDERETTLSKIIAILYGVLCIVLALAASKMGAVLQLALALFGIIGGPLLGVFVLGMFFPWANAKGAVIGTVSGFALAIWIALGAMFNPYPAPPLPTSTAGCPVEGNTTTPLPDLLTTLESEIVSSPSTGNSITDLYKLSYMYYGLISLLTVLFVGLLFSFITGATKPDDVDPRLLVSLSRKMFCCAPERCRQRVDCGVNHDEDQEKAVAMGAYHRGLNGVENDVTCEKETIS